MGYRLDALRDANGHCDREQHSPLHFHRHWRRLRPGSDVRRTRGDSKSMRPEPDEAVITERTEHHRACFSAAAECVERGPKVFDLLTKRKRRLTASSNGNRNEGASDYTQTID